jgi:hypothetical protein
MHLFCWYIKQLSTLTWVSYFVSTLGANCFIRGQRNINSWECFCVFVDPLSARWSIIWNVHTLFNVSKLFAPKFLMRFKFLQATQVDHSRLRRSGRALPPSPMHECFKRQSKENLSPYFSLDWSAVMRVNTNLFSFCRLFYFFHCVLFRFYFWLFYFVYGQK